jgi:Prealbumin-like fold domain
MRDRLISVSAAVFVALLFMAGAAALAVDEGLFELGDGLGTPGSANILGSPTQPGPDWSDLFEPYSTAAGVQWVPKDSNHDGTPDAVEIWGGLTAQFLKDQLAVSGTDDTSFATSNKNDMLISDWEWGTGKVTPKDDISNAYAYAVIDPSFNPGHLIIYAGLERIKVQGDSHVDIELNQNKIGLDSPVPCPTNTCGFTGEKADGDILISMNFVQGGRLGDVEVRKWNTSTSPPEFDLVIELTPDASGSAEGCNTDGGFPPDSVCAFNNGSSINGGPWPNYNSSDEVIVNLPTNAFTEIGVDVTALLGYTPCLSTIQVKSRTAQSFNSQLKDFVLGQFNICGSLTLIKDAIPDDPQTFDFNVTGPNGMYIDTTLDDYPASALPNMTTITKLLDGHYTASESQPPGDWRFQNLTCFSNRGGTITVDKNARQADIDLNFGEDATCIFTNVLPGKIRILKETDPDEYDQDFDFVFSNGTTIPFKLNDAGTDSREFDQLDPGTYTITETEPDGWNLENLNCVIFGDATTVESGTTSTITLGPGADVECTYTNRTRGSIKIVKDSIPNNHGFFNYSGSLGTNGTFGLAGDTFVNFTGLLPGTYDVKEILPEGWKFTNLTCVESKTLNSSNAGTTSTIVLDPGENVTCTYTNTELGSITVVKQADPHGSTFFNFSGAAPFGNFSTADTGFGNNSTIFPNLDAGTYTVYELIPYGWDLIGISSDDSDTTGSVDKATGRSTIELDPGEDVTVTYSNRERGSITIVKDSVPDSTGFFNYTSTAFGGFGLAGDTQTTFSNLTSGSYNVEELVPAGWKFDNLSCFETRFKNSTEDGTTSHIQLDPGESVTCTYRNTQLGKIIIVKDSIPDSTGFFNYSGDLGTNGTFGLAGDTQTQFDDLDPGNYSVKEIVPAGWMFTNLTCVETATANSSHVGTTSNITLDPGETVTCTYTNTALGSIRVVKEAVPQTADAFDYESTGGLSPSSFSLVDNGGVNYIDFTNLAPGTYTITEQTPLPTDYYLANVTIAGDNGNSSWASATATVVVDPGEDIVVTFYNVVPSEGCTPGYWKNHPDMWPAPWTPDTPFSDAFGMDPCISGGAGMTLMEALNLQGGGKKALTRHAAAAFLNAATPEVDSYTTGWVVSMYQAACADPSLVNSILSAFVSVNESCCPCNNTSCDNDCQPPTL